MEEVEVGIVVYVGQGVVFVRGKDGRLVRVAEGDVVVEAGMISAARVEAA